jgi:hypothetical protein
MLQKPVALISESELKGLRSHLAGEAFVPGDAGYDQASLNWEPLFRQQPSMVVLPVTTADVVAAVRFARKFGLPIGIQAGGHGHPFQAEDLQREGAMLINFARMKNLQIDPLLTTARVEPGVVWSEVISLASQYGLAPLSGFASGVGVTGYLLGGGFGWLVRQYGLGAGSIRSLEMVTAEGYVLQVSPNNHPDLFWGLRGGGGNFGIVTSLEFALYPVKEVFGGQVIYPIEESWKVFPAYLEWVKTVPETLTSTFRTFQFPPVPEVPPILQGKTVAMVLGCYNGSEAEGTTLFQPMRTLATPLLDTFARLPYSQIGTISNDPDVVPPLQFYNSHTTLHKFSPDKVRGFLEIITNPEAGLFEVELRHLGGMLARIPEDEMATSLCDVNFSLYALAAAPTAELLERGRESVTKIIQALPSDASVSVLFNALAFNDIGPERTRAAFTSNNYQRLVALKNRYDPYNVFHFNNNILPSS